VALRQVTVDLKYWHFDQNNSGGKFVVDEKSGIGHEVFIEATSIDDACLRAEGIGIYFNGCSERRDCSCCGDRWYRPWQEGKEKPLHYDKPLNKLKADSFFHSDIFIHRFNGDIIHMKCNKNNEFDIFKNQKPCPDALKEIYDE